VATEVRKTKGRIWWTVNDSSLLQKEKPKAVATRSGDAGVEELTWEIQISMEGEQAAKGLTIA
jgi:hypothetical protein